MAQHGDRDQRIPALPAEPDRTGRHAEVPDASPLIYLVLGGMGLLLASAIGFFPMHNAAAGILFLGVFLATAFYLTMLGLSWSNRLFSRSTHPAVPARRAEEPAGGPGEAKAARVAAMGDILADPDCPLTRQSARALSREDAETIERNRAAEADATWQWLLGCPDYEDLSATSDDGLSLAGHVLRCNPGSSWWLVFAHGYDSCWNEGMLYARHWAEWGFNLLFVEQRACGASGGRLMGMGWPERRDLVAWARELVRAEGEDVRVVLMGDSMGAATVAGASGEEDLPTQVCAGVCDSGFTDAWNVLIPWLRARGVRPHPTIDVTSLVLRNRRGGTNLLSIRPVNGVKRSRIPLLFLHGDRDLVVPPYMALDFNHEAGGAAAGENHELLTFPRAGHVQSSLSEPERYFSSVHDFVLPYVEGTRVAEYVEPEHEREPILGGRVPDAENPLLKR